MRKAADVDAELEQVRARIKSREAKTGGSAAPTSAAPEDTWPALAPEAMHGLAGEVVRVIAPFTESDPVALLIQFLVSFGNALGRGPYYLVESDRHHTNLFVTLVGETSKARKGTAAGRVRDLMCRVDADWAGKCISSGLSSGEGVIWRVRDPIYKTKNGTRELDDEGVSDKRLLLDEREFFQALSVMRREGNILSRIVRDAWDRGDLESITKHNPAKAVGAHISIVGHITEDELRQNLDHTSFMNGFANRFLYASVRRSKMLPHGGSNFSENAKDSIAANILAARNAAGKIGRVTMTEPARAAWEAIYATLSAGKPGLLGAACGRAEAQTIRLALIYALLDGTDQIDLVHLKAAVALWDYCERSAMHIFGDMTGNVLADEILLALRRAGADGLTRTQISNLFSHHRSSGQMGAALAHLAKAGKAISKEKPSGGRSAEFWVAT
jgi:hypothetical protein